MSFSFSKIGTKLSIAKHLMSSESQLADDPKSLAAILPLLTGADDSTNYELTASGHGGHVGSLNLRAVGAIVAMLVCALLLLPALGLAQTIPDPTPAQLQQIASDLQALQTATAADTSAQATVVSDSAALTQAQTTLASDQAAQVTTAANVQAGFQTLLADVQLLSPAAQTALLKALQAPQLAPTGPGPHDFHGGPAPQPFRGGDWHGGDGDHGHDFHGGGWQPQPVNPWNFVIPVITNFATAPRYVTNPATGQAELRTPGQWVQPAPGQWAWQALPIWPLSKAATKPERLRPLHRLVIHLHLL